MHDNATALAGTLAFRMVSYNMRDSANKFAKVAAAHLTGRWGRRSSDAGYVHTLPWCQHEVAFLVLATAAEICIGQVLSYDRKAKGNSNNIITECIDQFLSIVCIQWPMARN